MWLPLQAVRLGVDLIILDMIDYNIILGMDWLSFYHTILDYYSKTVNLAMQGVSRLDWRGILNSSPKGVISFLHSRCIIKRGCLSYLAHIHDTSIASLPLLDFIRVIHEFMDVFSMDLPSIPLDHNINFDLMWSQTLILFLFFPIGWP